MEKTEKVCCIKKKRKDGKTGESVLKKQSNYGKTEKVC